MNFGLYRAINTLLLIGAVFIIGLAGWLDPDPTGVGTHMQLGLNRCVLLQELNLPCPMCGMTTTFALMADLQWLAAFQNQPLGVVLFFLTCMVAIVSATELIKPRSLWSTISTGLYGKEVTVLTVFFVLMVASWGYKIVRMQIFLTV